jgi:RimJ/RimL family protein N-acetyltransferase
MTQPDPPVLHGPRVWLAPLQVEHADVMAPLLDDPRLHAFIGGRPASAGELRQRYRRQVVGRSPDGNQRWMNWIVRRVPDGQALGTVQATVTADDGGAVAEVAWVIASPFQRRGYAREAAQLMVAWLRDQGADRLVAHVHPDHQASAAVARAIGLTPGESAVDGEVRWQSPPER